jgi:hypothetical protein
MLNTAVSDDSVNESKTSESPVCWGAEAIGKAIGRSTRQTNHLLATGQIQSAKKIGGKWIAGRAALLSEFGAGQ